LAKATTSKDRRLAARSRAARASSASASAPAGDEAVREEEIDPAEDTMMEDDADQPEEQEDVAEENALPAAFSGERSLSSTADRTALRTYTVPAWTLGNPVTRFIAESYIELRKVTWPTWNEAWNWTLVVIAMSAIVALILAAADIGLTHLLTWVVSKGTGK
jgi:preprotein translocase SecE subunit